jgi:hypothetical protein
MEKIFLKKLAVLQPTKKFPNSILKFISEKLILIKPSMRALARYA